jgi:inosine-uridine nucleoside N-ribohydrolase
VIACMVGERRVRMQVTHTVLATPAIREQIAPLHSEFGRTTLDLLEFFASTYQEVFKFEHPPLHDPVAVVHVLRPDLFQSELMRVDVETNSTLTSGQTVCDVWHQSDKPKNVTVVLSVDVDACWDIILDAIRRCDATSTLNK